MNPGSSNEILWAISIPSHTRVNQKLLQTSIKFPSINTNITDENLSSFFILFYYLKKNVKTLQLLAELKIKVNL